MLDKTKKMVYHSTYTNGARRYLRQYLRELAVNI